MGDQLNDLVDEVRASRPPAGMTSRIVAVDGLAGAGKSTFARRLAALLGDVPIVPTDDFASWDEPFDWWPRFLEQVLEPLARNEAARYVTSSWGPGHEQREVQVRPAPFVVVEGVGSARRAFRPFLAYAFWIEAPHELRLSRGLERDGEDARPLWEAFSAAEHEYVASERPREAADAVVAGDMEEVRVVV
jgi:uridine kinase